MIPTLRDYQQIDLEKLRDAFRQGAKSVLYQAPTGSGKTVLFATITDSAASKGSRVWIVVHRQELVDQCSRELTKLSVPHGLVIAGKATAQESVLVCSVQSLVRRLDRIGPVDLIVLDEAHHAVAGTWRKVLQSRPDAEILGVTATPQRLDGRGLGRLFGGHFDHLVVGPPVKELMDAGWLAQAQVFIPPQIADLADMKIRGGDFAIEDAAARMDRPTVTGDAIGHYERICNGAPALVFCTRVQHAENVAAAFRVRGWRAESIDGKLSKDLQRHRIASLGDGRLQILTSCEIVSEGVDIPVVTAAILLRPTNSMGMYLQQVGRVLRPSPGKEHAIILDHVGNCMKHGFPDDVREWSLAGRQKSKGGEVAPSIRVCPQCFAAVPVAAKECRWCEFVFPPAPEREIEQVDGELVEATKETRQYFAAQKRSQVGRARTREALEAIAEERNYSLGWVDYILKARKKSGARGPVNQGGTIKEWKGEARI